MSRWPRAGAVSLAVAVSGCVMIPVTVQRYEPGCAIAARRMVLQPVQVAVLQGCNDQGCVALLAAAGVTAAASTVISGSIMLAGNLVYWLERQGQCAAPAPRPPGP